MEEDSLVPVIRLAGRLSLGDGAFSTGQTAHCEFIVYADWVTYIPAVTCRESWLIRKSPEWHINERGGICFEFDLNWSHELGKVVDGNTHGLAADYAAAWLLNSTRSLLRRHLFAHREGITVWPAEWDFWPHEAENAEREFRKSLAEKGNAPSGAATEDKLFEQPKQEAA